MKLMRQIHRFNKYFVKVNNEKCYYLLKRDKEQSSNLWLKMTCQYRNRK